MGLGLSEMASLPSREDYLVRWAAQHGGYDPRRSPLVRGWLGLVHACAAPLATLGVHPDVLTALGVVVATAAVWPAALGGGWSWLAAGLVLLAGLLDSLDGAVAVLSRRASAWGRVLDSVADRCSEVAFLLALWAAGAPAAVCVAAGTASGLLEYTRARAGTAGMAEIGLVTVGERPTRVLVAAAFLATASLGAPWAAAGAWTWLVTASVGLVQLLVVVRRRTAGRTD